MNTGPSPRPWGGLTLIEVVITVGVTALLVMALASIFLWFNTLYSYQGAYRSATDTVGRVLHATEEVAIPAHRVVASHAFASETYSSTATTLVVEVPSIDTDGNVIVGQYDYAVIYATDGAAYRQVERGNGSVRQAGTKKLGSNVTVLSFTYDNVDVTSAATVTIDVTSSTTTHGTVVSGRGREALRLRNF